MSILSSLGSLTGVSPGSSSTPSSASSTGFGQTDFLKLLVTQMKSQDPLDPMKDTDFMSQLAQLSTVDGINKLNQNFSDFMTLQGLSQGTNLIGKSVSYANTAGATVKGTVAAVRVDATGKIQLAIGSDSVALSQVRSIEQGTSTSTSTTR